MTCNDCIYSQEIVTPVRTIFKCMKMNILKDKKDEPCKWFSED